MAYLPVRSVTHTGPRGGVASGWSPWTCREEWEEVYSWLYSSEPALVQRGVGRVCGWKCRGHVPMMVEMTADLCECRFQERSKDKSGAHFQALALQYSMAITRFVNGMGDIIKDKLRVQGNLTNTVDKYGIPSWIVTLRHCGTHEKLPSLGALRAGAEFCLSWLRANYWRPQRLTIGDHVGGARSHTAMPTTTQTEAGSESVGKESRHIGKLTRGLCGSREQLVSILVHSHYSALKEYLMQKQLLQFPPYAKYELEVPAVADLEVLCSLTVAHSSIGIWRTHLRKAAHRSSSLKQRLVSALMCTINDTSCEPSLRDFLCGWLGILFDSPQQRVCIIKVLEECEVEEEEEVSAFIPGELDWMELLKVAKLYPGYYSYAVMKVIMENLKSLLSDTVVSQVLQLSSLVTLSSRIHQNTPNPLHPRDHASLPTTPQCRQLQKDLTTLQTVLERKLNSGLSADVAGRGGGSGEGGGESEEGARWKAVEDMSVWLQCPLGLCPAQVVSSDMFELDQLSSSGKEDSAGVDDPTAQQDSPPPGPSAVVVQSTGFSLGEGSEDTTFRLDTYQLQNLKSQVRIL